MDLTPSSIHKDKREIQYLGRGKDGKEKQRKACLHEWIQVYH